MKFAQISYSDKKIPCVYFEEKDIYFSLNDLSLSSKDFASANDFIERHTENDIKIIDSLYKEKFKSVNNFYEGNGVKILPPIDNIKHDILCVGLNYKDHVGEIKEMPGASDMPMHPVFFSKRCLNLIGVNDSITCGEYTNSLDYEVELAVIIGKKAKDVSEANAESIIFGYTIFNDISARDLQKQNGQWFKGKSLDSSSSIGPYIVHKSVMPLPLSLNVKSAVNKETRQNSNTKYFIFDIPRVISELSYGMTLLPCDIIATGTPSGVGIGFNPPKTLRKGDTMECIIENIGILKNIVD